MRVDLVERANWFTAAEYDEGLAIATACPGPLAYQLGVYCGYLAHGFTGAIVVALTFALPPFLIVTAGAYAYARFGSTLELRGLFWGVAPIVVALIIKSCWSLGRTTLRRETLAWVFAAVACAITIVVQKELVAVFLVAGAIGIVAFGPRSTSTVRLQTIAPWGVAGVPLLNIFAFFFKTGFLVFGSGLVIVPFLKAYVVDQYHWLNNQSFVDAVAIGIVSPGPVVITATFVGYLLHGITGALCATAGIFLPSLVFVLAGTPLLRRYRRNRSLQGFIRGVTSAVVGVLIGTSWLIARSSLHGWAAFALLFAAIALLFSKWKIPDQTLVAAGAVIGVIVFAVFGAP
jgi:chromate transporter